MKDRKMYYLTMMAGILILTFLVPVIIRAASRAFINRFAPDAAQEQTEGDEDRYRVVEGYAETEDDGRSPEISSSGRNSETGDKNSDEQHEHDPDLVRKELQEQKEQTDTELSSYLRRQNPALSESRAGMLEAFAEGREEALTKAVADHLYGTYGSLYDISAIDVVDFIDDNKTELTCQIMVTAKIGSREYSEYYFATYNKAYDFYSIYAYHE